MPFAIGAGAILRIDHADVDVLHTQIAIDLGGLGVKASDEAKQCYKDWLSFHGNKVN